MVAALSKYCEFISVFMMSKLRNPTAGAVAGAAVHLYHSSSSPPPPQLLSSGPLTSASDWSACWPLRMRGTPSRALIGQQCGAAASHWPGGGQQCSTRLRALGRAGEGLRGLFTARNCGWRTPTSGHLSRPSNMLQPLLSLI